MRRRRRELDAASKRGDDERLIGHIRSMAVYRKAARIALYLAFDGEPDLNELIRGAWRQHKQLYAPVLSGGEMQFARLTPRTEMRRNSFGISEPEIDELIDARSLDLVLTPLLAFDDNGVRLGIGRAYYDRRFSFLLGRHRWFHPKLVGVAYDFQRQAHLEAAAWDVPLWGVVTPSGSRIFR